MNPLARSSELARLFAPTPARALPAESYRLLGLLNAIADADAHVRMQCELSRAGADIDVCATAADAGEDAAANARMQARQMIEAAFPGVSWDAIRRAEL